MHDRTTLRDLRPTPDTLAGVLAYAMAHGIQVCFERPAGEFSTPQVRVETYARLPEVPVEPQRMQAVRPVDWTDVVAHRGEVLRIVTVRAIFDLEDDIAARGGTITTEVSA